MTLIDRIRDTSRRAKSRPKRRATEGLLRQCPGLSDKSPLRSVRPLVEALEARIVLSGFSPQQMRHAYGLDRVGFEDANHPLVAGDGTGQTIAIVNSYDDPNIASDLAYFDGTYGLPAPPSFTKVNQNGGTSYPAPSAIWAPEITLDVEWAHSMAPGAKILLVEANDNNFNNQVAAVQYAANSGASVVSMSFGTGEFSGETGYDGDFTHPGTTYLAATGDNGVPAEYAAYSPNVVAVGGTSLYLDSNGNYSSESGWSGSGGGVSTVEAQPAYQNGVVSAYSTSMRCAPTSPWTPTPPRGHGYTTPISPAAGAS